MKTSAAKILTAVLLAAIVPAANAAISSQYYTAPQYLSINGTACPELVSWTGGDASARVVLGPAPGAGATVKKQIGNVVYEPIIMVVSLPLSPALQNSLADLCANRNSTQNLLLTHGDGTKLEATNAQLIEARFPALEGVSKNQWRLTLVFRPESTHPVTGGSTGSAGADFRPKGATSSNFRFTLGSLPVTQVSSIEAFTITRTAAGGVGTERDYTALPGSTQIPDLNVIINQPGAAAWSGWRDDFIVQGNSDDAKEKNGSLQLLGIDLQTVLLSLQLSHVGIKRFAQLPRLADTGSNKYRAELYCEEMSMASVPVTGATAPAATPETPAPTPATSPAETAPADDKTPAKERTETTPAPAPAETAPADSKTAADPKAPAKEPEKTPGTAPAETVPAPAPAPTALEKPVTNPEDKGPRDPADFPRADGTRRTQYSAVRETGFVQETANYTAKAKSDDIMAFYEKRLKGSGWEETARYENDNGTDRAHQIQTTWKKDIRTASMTFMDTATGNVEIQVVLQERK